MAASGVEEHARADDVGVDEILRGIDAPVDVRFRREIDDREELLLVEQGVHLVCVRDIGLEKLVALAVFLHHAVEIREVSGVGEGVNIRHRSRLVMLQNVTNKVTPDESTTTRDQHAHRRAT